MFYAPSGCARPPSSPGRTAESPVLLGFRVQVGSITHPVMGTTITIWGIDPRFKGMGVEALQELSSA